MPNTFIVKFVRSLLIALLPVASVGFAVECIPPEYNDSGVVKYVNDGDTFTLHDGRKIRLLGIDAPEVEHLYPEKSEALALPATDLLKSLLPEGSSVSLRHDVRVKDKYGRTLAVVVNQQRQNVSEALLKAGLARQYWIPPNYYGWFCYQLHERQARAARVGLWALAENQPRSAVSVQPESRRQVDVVGKITRIEDSPKSLHLVLDNRIYVELDKQHLELFSEFNLRTQLLETVRITGRVYDAYDRLRMRLEHPWQLALISNLPPRQN
ncbi:thermonuclease family protein [Corallincola luteus]|uniref:Thermonuclease family protein n=1 Tax=Corallincola luteus TaxID=1775177 RepID=A0ABY2AMQ8_9GAMM|nr:thermonuclease family protein [Corallincola luteus]TCI04489.1 thermonuclease family protein [Corallincola luteus]